MPRLIEIHNVELEYVIEGRKLQVLKKINMNVERGEMVAILGPSGSGKSTLLYILGCLLKASHGSFIFTGKRVESLNADSLADLRSREIGFVFQQFHLLARATVLENVLLPTRYLRGSTFNKRDSVAREKKARDLIESVGLTSHLGHRPNQLSGGQQQRVAIARALINEPSLILADEPTGNLDSDSAAQVLGLLRKIQAAGRTVVIITHDHEVALRCDRVVRIRDGVMTEDERSTTDVAHQTQAVGQSLVSQTHEAQSLAPQPETAVSFTPVSPTKGTKGINWREDLSSAWQNLRRNKVRSGLTMLGVTIGIAAVLSTITLGSYTREKILQSYESLGINKLVVRAYPNYHLRAQDIHNGVIFDGISTEHDMVPMRRLFPEIRLASPVVRDSIKSVEYGGRSVEEAQLLGVNAEYFAITNRNVKRGRPFSQFHHQNRSRVCVIGSEIATKLFLTTSPIDEVIQINAQGSENKQYSCRVVGVMTAQSSNNEWFKPNLQILMADTFLSMMARSWNSKAYEMNIQIRSGASIEELRDKVRKYFEHKYGKTVEIYVDSDQILLAQMRKFLNLFSLLLTCVAAISLSVGGIGITNMMLVSVAERFKEIGLRKALGAHDHEIRLQFLIESLILCLVAGVIGVVGGIAGYHSILYLASRLTSKVQFEWVFNWPAMLFSAVCIALVGLGSGLVPALRAEKLQVVEALRSE